MFANAREYISTGFIKKRNYNVEKLSSLIDDKDMFTYINKNEVSPNYYIFPLLLNNRYKIYKELLNVGFEAGFHFSNSIDWALDYGYSYGDCPNTEKIIKKIITIPMHEKILKNDIVKISKILNNCEAD